MQVPPLEFVQVVAFGVSVTAFIVSIVWLCIKTSQAAYIITPMIFALHAIMFYSVIVLREFGYMEFYGVGTWTSWLLMHGLATSLVLMLMVVVKERNNNGNS